MKKILRVILTAALAVAIFAGISAVAGRHDKPQLTIIHVNDTHSHVEPVRGGKYDGLGGAIERAAFIDSVRNADGEKNVLLLHAGDFCQGTTYYTELKGDIEVKLINAMGYDCIALGNHEFDNGVEDLARRLSQVNCPVVCANYDFSPFELGKYVRPYAIVKKAGMKIGIIGLLTDITRVVERTIADRIPKMDPVAETNKWAKFLREQEECDLVIALTHIGWVTSDGLSDPELVASTKGLDLVVGGHSHTFLDKMEYGVDLDGRSVPIVTDGCWGINTGILKMKK